MADEFKHLSAGTSLTQGEYEAVGGHVLACQATGDIVYASSGSQLSRLGKGAANTVLAMGGSCIPAWTASPSVTDLTIGGGCITLSAATDIDLLDNTTSALSFDASGKAGIIAINTNNCSEGVTMSGTLTVGVDDTGADVKFFGASAGAYMEWDESANMLEVRGATAAGPGHLKLTTGEATVVACDVLGKLEFQAPAECGTDAITIAARIAAIAQGTFSATVNATDLVFYTGHSECATEKIRITSQGEIGIGGANYGTDGQVLTSTGAGTAPAWEDAAGGGITINANCNNNVITATGTANCVQGEANLTWNGAMLQQGAVDAMPLLSGTWASNYSGYLMNAYYSGGWKYAGDDPAMGIRFHGAGSFSGSMLFNVTPSANTSGAGATISTWDCATATSGSIKMVLDKCGALYLGDSANANVTTGLTLNQGANDNGILAFKSSDVNTSLTSLPGQFDTEADTFADFGKAHVSYGGLMQHTYSTDTVGWHNQVFVGSGTTGKSAATCSAAVMFQIWRHNCSNGNEAMETDMNILALQTVNNGSGATRFLFDQEGTFHADVSSTTYDDYCDIELMKGVLAETVPCYRESYQERFGRDVVYNRCWYEDNKIIGRDSIHWETRPCGKVEQRAMINFTGLAMLHHSTIIQLADKTDARLTALENRLALGDGK